MLLIKDLAALTPQPVADSAEKLMTAWRENGDKLTTSFDAASVLSEEVLLARRAVLESLRSLK